MGVFTSFCKALRAGLKRKKPDVGRRITFLGLEGVFAGRDNGMTLSADPAESKKRIWAARISGFIDAGVISRRNWNLAPVGSLSANLHF